MLANIQTQPPPREQAQGPLKLGEKAQLMSSVSSLVSRSLDVLVKHIDKVSSLGGLPEEVLVALFQVKLSCIFAV
jgi:hypothetical protein